MIFPWVFDHRMRLALWAVLSVAAVVLAACGGNGGTYQGGSDSEPYFR